jgi:tRNA G18 (ribose-2'-O)-methylase SpoU
LHLENRPKAADFPSRVAVVIGRESDGVSAEMLTAADRRVFIPMFGFTEVGKFVKAQQMYREG